MEPSLSSYEEYAQRKLVLSLRDRFLNKGTTTEGVKADQEVEEDFQEHLPDSF